MCGSVFDCFDFGGDGFFLFGELFCLNVKNLIKSRFYQEMQKKSVCLEVPDSLFRSARA